MLQIKLGRRRQVDPATDPLGRTYVGFFPGMSAEEAWESGRGVWKLAADRVLQQDEVEIIDENEIVLAVASILGVMKAGDRQMIEGNLLPADPRIGRRTLSPHPSRNAITYF